MRLAAFECSLMSASRRQAPTNRSACRATADGGTRLAPPRLHCRPSFAIDLPSANRLALVVFLLAFDERQRDLHAPILQVHPQGNQREAFFCDPPHQLLDFMAMQQELAVATLVVVRIAGVTVG